MFVCKGSCWGFSSIVLFINNIPTKKAESAYVASLLLDGFRVDSVILIQLYICLILLNPRVSNSCSRMQNGTENC